MFQFSISILISISIIRTTGSKHPVAMEVENPEEVLSVLDNLMQNILVAIEYAQQEKR